MSSSSGEMVDASQGLATGAGDFGQNLAQKAAHHTYSGSWNLYREVADIFHIVGTLASLDPFKSGFWVFLGSDMKGSSEIDRGFGGFWV